MNTNCVSLQTEDSEHTEICQNMQMSDVNYSYADNFTVGGNTFIDAPHAKKCSYKINLLTNHSIPHLFATLRGVLPFLWEKIPYGNSWSDIPGCS